MRPSIILESIVLKNSQRLYTPLQRLSHNCFMIGQEFVCDVLDEEGYEFVELVVKGAILQN